MSKEASKRTAPAQGADTTDERSFDERLEDLETIAAQLEGGDLGLEEALEQYRRGVHMLRSCREELLAVRAQVEELAGPEGTGVRPLDADPDGPYGE